MTSPEGPEGAAGGPWRVDGSPGSVPVALGMVLGDFQVVRELGRGGMGIVYEALQLSLGRRVALKVLTRAATLEARKVQRFRQEARVVAGLDHANIVPIYSVGSDGDLPYYAMQLVEGRSLSAILHKLRLVSGLDPTGGPAEAEARTEASTATVGRFDEGPTEFATHDETELGPAMAPLPAPPSRPSTAGASARGRAYFRSVASLGRQAAEALSHAHALGVVHRDIKPSNLLVNDEGRLWVADFGIALLQGESDLTLTGELLGTLRYMSPEQVAGRQGRVDPRTDVYSLGATLYELLTLRPAFEGDDRPELLHRIVHDEPRPPRQVNASVPVDLETIVAKAMAKDPADRYEGARALADDLGRFLEDRPVLARPVGRVELLRRWCLRPERIREAGLALLWLGLLTSGLSVLWGVGFLIGRVEPRRPPDFVRDVLIAFLVFDAPPIWCGLRTLARKRLGLELGLLTTLNFLAFLIVSLSGRVVLDYGGVFDEVEARSPFEALLLLLVANAAVRIAIALAAQARGRSSDPGEPGGTR